MQVLKHKTEDYLIFYFPRIFSLKGEVGGTIIFYTDPETVAGLNLNYDRRDASHFDDILEPLSNFDRTANSWEDFEVVFAASGRVNRSPDPIDGISIPENPIDNPDVKFYTVKQFYENGMTLKEAHAHLDRFATECFRMQKGLNSNWWYDGGVTISSADALKIMDQLNFQV